MIKNVKRRETQIPDKPVITLIMTNELYQMIHKAAGELTVQSFLRQAAQEKLDRLEVQS